MIFDLFITLTDFDAERRRPHFVAELADALGVDRTAFAAAMTASFTERATGCLGDLRTTLAILGGRLGQRRLDPTSLARAVALRIEHERQLVEPRDGVLEVLRRLRQLGLGIGVVTDCSSELPVLWESLPYAALVDAAVFSCEIGRRKPDRSLYEAVCQRLGVRAHDCLYIGDGGSGELSGARGAGMTAVMLQTPFGPEVRYGAEASWDGLAVADIAEVISHAVGTL